MTTAKYGLTLRGSRRIASMLHNKATNEAKQNTPDVAKITSHLPILQTILGTNTDKHPMIAAAISALLAKEGVTTFSVGDCSLMEANNIILTNSLCHLMSFAGKRQSLNVLSLPAILISRE
jgi:hypothetical protein